jgi:hypothetical protein
LGEVPGDDRADHGAMTRRWIGCSLTVVALALVGCSSNGGDGTPPSIPVSIPADLATLPPDAGPEPTAPSAEPPVEPAAPEAEAPVEAAPPADAADPGAAPEEAPVDAAVDEDADSTWWIWVLLAVAIIAVVALVASSAGRRRRAAAQWRTDTRATLDEIDQLTMRLGVAAPEAIGPVAVDGSARLATMGFSLQRLIDTAPDDASKSALTQVQAPLTNVRELVDSIALSPPPPTANTVEVLRARASSLHTTSASARAALGGA